MCIQEFFGSVPQEEWKLKDPAFIKESEEFAINKFKEWIIGRLLNCYCNKKWVDIMMQENYDKGFVKLFDGTLNGWEMAGEGKFDIVFENEEALLQTEGGMGLLWYYKKKFKDFILKLEWKATSKEDNSGLFLRFGDPQGDPWVAVNTGYEIQIDDLGQPDGNPVYMTGAIYTFRGPSKMASKPAGQWNSLEIQATGQEYHVIVNGENVVADFIGNRLTEGYIGLQNHDENSKVFFKNIMIKEIQ